MIKIHPLKGGIHPPTHKQISTVSPIKVLSAPAQVWLPVSATLKFLAEPLCKVGDQVVKHQQLSSPVHSFAVPVFAPFSGTIGAIEMRTITSVPERQVLMIRIDNDHQDDQFTPTSAPVDAMHSVLKTLTADTLGKRIACAGITGHGGAGFSTQVKLAAGSINRLIINAAECEPYITADDVLMRYHSDDILIGAVAIAQLLDVKHITIGTEDNKPEALVAMQLVVNQLSQIDQFDIKIDYGVVETKYPSGGERQLIQLLTGREVPTGKLPSDLGLLMLNVGTLAAVKQAVIDQQPVTHRVVTLTGESVTEPANYYVTMGTAIGEFTKLVDDKPAQWIMGGPMMGVPISDFEAPVTQITNCLLVQPVAPEKPELPCIRCGACTDACPMQLLPQQLFWHAKASDEQKLRAHNLFDCIECGACDYVCPSDIKLVQYYRAAKDELRGNEQDRIRSEHARARFEQRQIRLERQEAEKIAKREARKRAAAEKQQLAQQQAQATATSSTPGSSGLLAAAMNKAGSAKAPTLSADKLSKQVTNLQAQMQHQQQLLAEAADDTQRAKIDARIKNTQIKIDQVSAKLRLLEEAKQPSNQDDNRGDNA